MKKKLKLWTSYDSTRAIKLYVLCGFKSTGIKDIIEIFQRIEIIMKYGAIPYIMRYDGWDVGEMRGMYINLGRWCNQPSIFKKMSFREFAESHPPHYAAFKYAAEFEAKYPAVARQFYDLKFKRI